MSTIFVILWILTPLPYGFRIKVLKLWPIGGLPAPRISDTVAPKSAKVGLVPKLSPCLMCEPKNTIGMYSLVWSHPE